MGVVVMEPGMLTRLWHVPHRLSFFLGLLSMQFMAVWWAMALIWPGMPRFQPVLVHGLMMPLGVFPLFFLGFLLTSGPRWLAVSPQVGHPLPLVAYFVGVWLAMTGFLLGNRLANVGMLVMQAGWAIGLLRWLHCIIQSKAGDSLHPVRLAFIMTAGQIAMMLVTLWTRSGDGAMWTAARELLLWGFLLPLFLTIAHRMIPHFVRGRDPESALWQPRLLLDGWLIGCVLMVAGSWFDIDGLQLVACFVVAVSVIWTIWRWGLFATPARDPFLFMMHLGFLWVAPALILEAMFVLGAPIGASGVHALTLGFCSTTLIAFVSRLSLGNSGRSLRAGRLDWVICIGMHAIAIARVLIALTSTTGLLVSLLACMWWILIAMWTWRLVPIYCLPRADGKAG
ncbi:NnrS family protein [Burkholderiaceae bacterium DAT-1]|nr:NnrS family protein [Burkholderiaceae bacterium DAT-1]